MIGIVVPLLVAVVVLGLILHKEQPKYIGSAYLDNFPVTQIVTKDTTYWVDEYQLTLNGITADGYWQPTFAHTVSMGKTIITEYSNTPVDGGWVSTSPWLNQELSLPLGNYQISTQVEAQLPKP